MSRSKIGSIVIDCDDFEEMMKFWMAVLRYMLRSPPKGGWVVLRDPVGKGPNVSLNLTSEGHLKEYRLHLDLYADDHDEEVARIRKLGARVRRRRRAGDDFTVLEDPDGNPFCVIDTRR